MRGGGLGVLTMMQCNGRVRSKAWRSVHVFASPRRTSVRNLHTQYWAGVIGHAGLRHPCTLSSPWY